MYRSRFLLLQSLLLTLLLASLIGWFLGDLRLGALLGALAWAGHSIWQFQRLLKWVQQDPQDEPPDASGAWGDLCYALYRRQRAAQERETSLRGVIRRFQQSSAALNDAIVIIDQHNHLEWWNRSAETLLGFKTKSDRRKSILNLLRDPRFVRYYRKGQYQEPLELVSPRDPNMTLLYNIIQFGEGDRLLVARDISRLKRLEQTRQTFVANASHELRTPLTVMRGYLETFLEQDLPRPLLRGLSQMQQQTQRMESLVRDLLLLSRLESSQQIQSEEPIEIHHLLKRIQRDALILSAEKQQQITLDLDADKDLLGQESELYSAFSNLVFNAVRYTPAQSEIRIRWQTDSSGGHFSVCDNGPGIEAMHLPRLTERFYRVDEGRSSESGGTGLGLSIVKHVLMRHGARLEIQSKIGQGSCFICHFPADLLTQVEIDASETDNNALPLH